MLMFTAVKHENFTPILFFATLSEVENSNYTNNATIIYLTWWSSMFFFVFKCTIVSQVWVFKVCLKYVL